MENALKKVLPSTNRAEYDRICRWKPEDNY